MNDSLANYWNTPVALSARASFCLQEGGVTGKQSTCRSISWGQGNTLKMEDTRVYRGNGRYRNIPLVDTFGYIFPKTSQDRKPFIKYFYIKLSKNNNNKMSNYRTGNYSPNRLLLIVYKEVSLWT